MKVTVTHVLPPPPPKLVSKVTVELDALEAEYLLLALALSSTAKASTLMTGREVTKYRDTISGIRTGLKDAGVNVDVIGIRGA